MASQNNTASVLHTHTEPSPGHPPQQYTYYHAGPLFTVAELHTNVLLSKAISELSSGKFIPVLPQDLEQRDLSPHAIRDKDLRALLSCDLALFTYDGSELDAGTVVEYMVAKMADIPAVILRTDFRGAGDQGGKGDSWNLMSSNWPRTVGVTANSMLEYKESLARALKEGKETNSGPLLVNHIAQKVVDGFASVLETPPRLPKQLRESVYQWLALMPGFKDGDDAQHVDALSKLCKDKVSGGLL